MQKENRFVLSAKEMKNVRVLAAAAMLLAIAVVIGFFTLQVTESLKVGFSFLADELSGSLFGPVVGGISGGLADILKFLIKPTGPYFPGLTVSGVLSGLVYGIVLYRRPVTLPRVILANSVVSVFINIFLNTYWLTLLYGRGFAVIFPARVVKELVLLPVNIALFYIVNRLLSRAKILQKIRGERP